MPDDAHGDAPAKPPAADSPPAASRAEQVARKAPDHQIAPHEKKAIATETSREEDA